MGAESCEKSESLQTFFRNFPHVRSLWEQKVAKKVWKLSLSTIIARSGAKVCKLFALQMWQKKVARRKKYRFGVRQNHELFSRVTQPIQSVVHNHAREPHTTHTTPNMDMDNEIEASTTSQKRLLWQQQLQQRIILEDASIASWHSLMKPGSATSW